MLKLILITLVVLTGCKLENDWVPRYEPTTDAQRAMVEADVEKIMMINTESFLINNPKDWDKMTNTVYEQAKTVRLPLTTWERVCETPEWWRPCTYQFTGKWKLLPLEEVKPNV